MPTTYKRTAVHAANLRLDATTMLIERRLIKDIHENAPESVVSVHLWSDGSPVTGLELQGMVLQFMFVAGTVWTIILPGVVLRFGGTRLIGKAVALMWSLCLVAGTDSVLLAWLLRLVKSITTDMGTELGMPDVCNIMPAFLRRRAGASMASLTVDESSRFLPYALRIAGWGHMFGNLMKLACKCLDAWPVMLQKLRYMVTFFRNDTYRQEMIDQIKADRPQVKTELLSFQASFAKWRYETIYKVMAALLRLRELCQSVLAVRLMLIFATSQEADLMLNVVIVCRDEGVWTHVYVFFTYVIQPLEMARRWGLVCLCCGELRRGGQQVDCVYNSRRLHEARLFIAELVRKLNLQGRELSVAQCEGHAATQRQVSYSLRRVAYFTDLKGGYFKSISARVSEAEDPEQARICVDQLLHGNPEKFGPLELHYRDELLESLEATDSSQQSLFFF